MAVASAIDKGKIVIPKTLIVLKNLVPLNVYKFEVSIQEPFHLVPNMMYKEQQE